MFTNRISGKVGGIWLCGSSAHPGGGVMGAVGKQVAKRILYEKELWFYLYRIEIINNL